MSSLYTNLEIPKVYLFSPLTSYLRTFDQFMLYGQGHKGVYVPAYFSPIKVCPGLFLNGIGLPLGASTPAPTPLVNSIQGAEN